MQNLLITKSKNPPGASLWQKQTSFIHLIQKFTIMKKLILILILAFFASIPGAWSQAVHHVDPIPLGAGCVTDALHPIAGVPYEYGATLTNTPGIDYWFATTDPNFMVSNTVTANQELPGGNFVMPPADPNYRDNLINAGSPSTVTITWNSIGLATINWPATPLFVVLYYSNTTGGCADNLKVYPIDPVNAFTVDITNIEDGTLTTLAYGASETQCVDMMTSAVWVPGGPPPNYGEVNYDYGEDILYWEVVLANFTVSATCEFQITGLDDTPNGQRADLAWDYAVGGAYAHPITANSPNGTYPMPAGDPVLTNAPNTSNGVSIYVRMTIHNNRTETLIPNDVTLAVDATNAAGEDDVDNATCTIVTWEDLAMQTVDPRPTVNPTVPPGFIPPTAP
jgi:hypothetical protein